MSCKLKNHNTWNRTLVCARKLGRKGMHFNHKDCTYTLHFTPKDNYMFSRCASSKPFDPYFLFAGSADRTKGIFVRRDPSLKSWVVSQDCPFTGCPKNVHFVGKENNKHRPLRTTPRTMKGWVLNWMWKKNEDVLSYQFWRSEQTQTENWKFKN